MQFQCDSTRRDTVAFGSFLFAILFLARERYNLDLRIKGVEDAALGRRKAGEEAAVARADVDIRVKEVESRLASLQSSLRVDYRATHLRDALSARSRYCCHGFCDAIPSRPVTLLVSGSESSGLGNQLFQFAFSVSLAATFGSNFDVGNIRHPDFRSVVGGAGFDALMHHFSCKGAGYDRCLRSGCFSYTESYDLKRGGRRPPFCVDALRARALEASCMKLSGQWQEYRFIQPFKAELKRAFLPPLPPVPDGTDVPGPNDVAVHLRDCSYQPKGSTHGILGGAYPTYEDTSAWLRAVIDRHSARNGSGVVWVVTQRQCTRSRIVHFLQSRSPSVRVRSRSPLDDFRFLMASPRLVLTHERCQVSTFGWWAAFLGRASEIHFPLNTATFKNWNSQTWSGNRSSTAYDTAYEVNKEDLASTQPLLVFDESRYTYHDVVLRKYWGKFDPRTDSLSW